MGLSDPSKNHSSGKGFGLDYNRLIQFQNDGWIFDLCFDEETSTPTCPLLSWGCESFTKLQLESVVKSTTVFSERFEKKVPKVWQPQEVFCLILLSSSRVLKTKTWSIFDTQRVVEFDYFLLDSSSSG